MKDLENIQEKKLVSAPLCDARWGSVLTKKRFHELLHIVLVYAVKNQLSLSYLNEGFASMKKTESNHLPWLVIMTYVSVDSLFTKLRNYWYFGLLLLRKNQQEDVTQISMRKPHSR